jgi:preprotein translocase subunit SecF
MQINIIGKRYLFFLISAIIIIPGLILLAYEASTGQLPLAIDFTGGSLTEVKLDSGDLPLPSEVISFLEDNGYEDVKVQTTGEGTLVIRTVALDEAQQGSLIRSLQDEFAADLTILRIESVGATIGREVAIRAAEAVAVAAVIVVLFITFAFRGIPHAFRYGVCAILAMIHDVAVVLSVTAIGSWFFGWQIDALFLTALLTVIGFSVQDKIVVFDRIRENRNIYKRLPFETLVNHSVVQTLQRSINTQLMTVEFMLLSLALFGGVTLREFAIILLIGLLSGTYSSIFIASSTLVVWENREWTWWFNRKQKPAAA